MSAVTMDVPVGPRRGRFRLSLARSNRGIAIAALFLALVIIGALLAPWISPYDPATIDLSQPSAGPSVAHLLGTDALGRDTFSRLLWGARPALLGPVVLGAQCRLHLRCDGSAVREERDGVRIGQKQGPEYQEACNQQRGCQHSDTSGDEPQGSHVAVAVCLASTLASTSAAARRPDSIAPGTEADAGAGMVASPAKNRLPAGLASAS